MKRILFSIFALASISLSAQTVNVHYTDGTTESFATKDVKYIDVAETGYSYLKVSTDAVKFGATESNLKEFEASSNEAIAIECDLSWIHCMVSNNTVKVSVDPNMAPFSRTGAIRIAAGEKTSVVFVLQDANAEANEINVSANEMSFGNSGSEVKLLYVYAAMGEFTTSKDHNWIHREIIGSNTVQVRVDNNPNTSARTGILTIESGNKKVDITIKQAAGDPKPEPKPEPEPEPEPEGEVVEG